MPSDLDISQIDGDLFISAWPKKRHGLHLEGLGIRLILSMHWWRPAKAVWDSYAELLWLPTVDKPFAPIPIGTLTRGVTAALPVIASSGKVLCHCRYGIHRSVAMACSVLIGKGHSADDAMQLVVARRAVADPYVGYIQDRIRKFEQTWKQLDTRN